MNDEQCGRCHAKDESVLYRVSCSNYPYKWLCKECIKEIDELFSD